MKTLRIEHLNMVYHLNFDDKYRCISAPAEYGMAELLGKTSRFIISKFVKLGALCDWVEIIHFNSGVKSACKRSGKLTQSLSYVTCKDCLEITNGW